MSIKPKCTGSDVLRNCHAHYPPQRKVTANDLYHVSLVRGLHGLVPCSRGTWVTPGEKSAQCG